MACELYETARPASTKTTRNSRIDLLNWLDSFIVLPFFPAAVMEVAGPKAAKNLAGKCPPPDSDPFSEHDFEKMQLPRQAQAPQLRTAAYSSRNAVSFSSVRTTKRFPSSRCASAIQIVRPLPSIAET